MMQTGEKLHKRTLILTMILLIFMIYMIDVGHYMENELIFHH